MVKTMNNILISGLENVKYQEKTIIIIAELVLDYFHEKETEVSITFVESNEIKEMNNRFRKIDKPTDVLSFPQREGREHGFFNQSILGDVVISFSEVLKNAKENKVSPEKEFKIILTHGILHLLGYDHASIDEEKEMFGLQEKIVAEILEKVEL